MEFFINQNSTLPPLKMELINDGRNDFHKFFEEQGRRRNVNHEQVFPEMSDFFELCKEYI